MRFEGRELKPYAEPVSASDLQEGSVYFLLTFGDDDMKIPILETLVFVSKTDDGIFRFQDFESYRGAVGFKTGTEKRINIFECEEKQLNCIFEYERALDRLLACSLRRRGT
jgi:hypothetical protein